MRGEGTQRGRGRGEYRPASPPVPAKGEQVSFPSRQRQHTDPGPGPELFPRRCLCATGDLPGAARPAPHPRASHSRHAARSAPPAPQQRPLSVPSSRGVLLSGGPPGLGGGRGEGWGSMFFNTTMVWEPWILCPFQETQACPSAQRPAPPPPWAQVRAGGPARPPPQNPPPQLPRSGCGFSGSPDGR